MSASRILAGILAAAVSMAACADAGPRTDPLPAERPGLREVSISRLPSPFYRFEYDGAGRVTRASFASDLTSYVISYDGGRITNMEQVIGNRDRLSYSYDAAGRVSLIRVTTAHGSEYLRIRLAYQGSSLTRIQWDRLVQDSYMADRAIELSYYADGNLQEWREHRFAFDQLHEESFSTIRFEGYDSGINVDAFSLLQEDFVDHLFLLPGVQLQRGNPTRVIGAQALGDYTIDFSYSYDDRRRPVAKLGRLVYRTGQYAGSAFDLETHFLYY